MSQIYAHANQLVERTNGASESRRLILESEQIPNKSHGENEKKY